MENRKREHRIVFRVSEQEQELIKKRMEQSGIYNREAYLRKMAIDGYILHLDMSGIREMIYLLSNATNNLNQIAKRANETRNIYEVDICDLRADYELLWESAGNILKKLVKI